MDKKPENARQEPYAVTPQNGKCKAPAIYVDATSADDAIKKAMEKSGLARFKDQWAFFAKKA